MDIIYKDQLPITSGIKLLQILLNNIRYVHKWKQITFSSNVICGALYSNEFCVLIVERYMVSIIDLAHFLVLHVNPTNILLWFLLVSLVCLVNIY